MFVLRKFLRYGVYAAIFFAGVLCSVYLTSKWIIKSEEVVMVPDLVGHDTVYALDLLTSLGLNIKVGGFIWSEAVPKNFIASQEPAPGTRLKRDRDVKVALSRGSRSVPVPKLEGANVREAELVLSQNGLQLGGISRVVSDSHPRDLVIAQNPVPLHELERGRSVDLLVSDGPMPVAIAMPELRQRPVRQALQDLEKLGLAAAVKEVHRPGDPLHTVVGQQPKAGYRVDSNSSIGLTVNRVPRAERSRSKLWWLTYQVSEGYFKKEVALSKRVNGKPILLYRGIHRPGDQVEWLVWAQSIEEIDIIVDGRLQTPEASGFHWERVERLVPLSVDDLFAPVPLAEPRRKS
ncbi:MAG: PASTA domain-containing protein [Deltaproteobacteria bacterium]|nr:MAG: PASTA domain-containing protein [Deltaproteobacteria bacterium]